MVFYKNGPVERCGNVARLTKFTAKMGIKEGRRQMFNR